MVRGSVVSKVLIETLHNWIQSITSTRALAEKNISSRGFIMYIFSFARNVNRSAFGYKSI